jgi:hypothetical protein
MYKYRKYVIFNVSEISKIDFSQVGETSAETLRTSYDGTKTFVKWDVEQPTCIDLLSTKEGPYTHEEMLVILSTPEWGKPTQKEPL